MMTYIYIYL